MANKYLSYISDEHLVGCVENLYNSYQKAKANISKSKFYKNKIDTIKPTFDSKFNDLEFKSLYSGKVARKKLHYS